MERCVLRQLWWTSERGANEFHISATYNRIVSDQGTFRLEEKIKILIAGKMLFEVGCTNQTVFCVILNMFFMGAFGLIFSITFDFSYFVMMKNAKRS
ncbi:MAG: hypothetical protein V4594_13970 [Bacteroidota bacterium]